MNLYTYHDTPKIWFVAGPLGENLDLPVGSEAEHAGLLGNVLDDGATLAQQG